MSHSVEIEVGERTLTLETGRLAKQAGGAVIVGCGDSRVLVTATCAHEPRVGIDFFPLTVDYREYTYSAGRIPGGYIKREGRPSEKEILTCRLIDRPIRPLFPAGFRNETQVIAYVLSADPEFDPAVLALVGASAALAISNIPFVHTIGAVKVGRVNGDWVLNPTYEQFDASDLDIVVAAADAGIVMVEAGSLQAEESAVLGAIEAGYKACKKIVAGILELVEKAGKPKIEVTPPPSHDDLFEEIEKQWGAQIEEALDTSKYDKLTSQNRFREVKKQIKEAYAEDEEKSAALGKLLDALQEKIFRRWVLQEGRRPDRRAPDQIRPLECTVGELPRTHGSAIFTRGETQALVTVTLGTKFDSQRQELLESADHEKFFMVHYNFPPFSVGETAFLRGASRREIGHGMLAERALTPAMPAKADFPYTVRVVSDILESNGSSSMATVCGGTLALMDAGVPIASPVAGIAMGLVTDGEKSVVLTDIAGAEDHYGDMDFKVAGTRDGITALQMDIKQPNISLEVMERALEQARQARLQILDKMHETIDEPRTAVSRYAPRIYTITIPVSKIRDVIGPGGKMIKSIVEETGAKIDVADDGTVQIAASASDAAERAINRIKDLTATAEVGKTYLGNVTRIADFGAFVEIFPGTEGLLHISEIAEHRIRAVADELKVGDQILVKCLALEGNKIKLSRKAVLREQREKHGKTGAASPASAARGEDGKRSHRPRGARRPAHQHSE